MQLWSPDQLIRHRNHPDSHCHPTQRSKLTPSWTAQFDDLTAGGFGSNMVPAGYQSLRFPAFGVTAYIPTIDGTPPHSTPNRAAAGVRNEMLDGSGPGIDFAYPGATLKSFDLHSFYYACNLNAQNTERLPIACTIQVTGMKAETGNTVGPELINFSPASSVAGIGPSTESPMAFTAFSDFTKLSAVSLVVVLSSIPEASQDTTILLIDDVVHTNYE